MTQKITRYPGIKPFTVEYKDLFFGRDPDIERFGRLVQVEKLTVLYGKSGLGKSSLLNAGILPRLKQALPIFVRFYSFSEANQQLPLDRCRVVLQPHTSDTPLDRIDTPRDSLWQICKAIQWQLAAADSMASTVYLIFDQFEELFTYPPDSVQQFAKELADVLNNRQPRAFRDALEQKLSDDPDLLGDADWEWLESDLPIKIVFSIRSDRMSVLNRLTPHLPHILRHCYELSALDRQAAQAAIEKPARMDLEQVSLPPFQGSDDPPPRVSFLSPPFSYDPVLIDRILAYLTGNGEKEIESFQLQIICDHVEKQVIATGQTTMRNTDVPDLDQVYHSYYLKLIEQLPPDDQPVARHLIEDGLIFEAEERRLSLYEGQISEDFHVPAALLKQLVDSRLLRAEPNPGGGFNYELCHDSLVKPILLAKAQRVAAERERQQQEELRQAREKAAREEAQRLRERRRSLIVIGVVSVLALISLVMAIVAWQKNEEARQQAENAQIAQREALKQAADAEAARQQAEEAMGLATSTNFVLEMKQDSLRMVLNEVEQAKQTAEARLQQVLTAQEAAKAATIGKVQTMLNTVRDYFEQGKYDDILPELDLAAAEQVERMRVRRAYAELAYVYSFAPAKFTTAVEIINTHLSEAPPEGAKTMIELQSKAGPNAIRAGLQERIGDSVYDDIVAAYAGFFPQRVKIKGGIFTMGSPDSLDDREDDETQHEVQVSDFQIGTYEVTVAQYRFYCNLTGTQMASELSGSRHDRHPVVNVSWKDAVKYANWLNTIFEYTASMTPDAGLFDPVRRGYRLPTEAEWEFAARSRGLPEVYAGTSHTDSLTFYAWYNGNSGQPHPVGRKLPNTLGLYDMSGNVWEWCSDWYDGDYYELCAQQGVVENPVGPPDGSFRVMRGGSWNYYGLGCRTSNRYSFWPDNRSDYIGFRLVFVP